MIGSDPTPSPPKNYSQKQRTSGEHFSYETFEAISNVKNYVYLVKQLGHSRLLTHGYHSWSDRTPLHPRLHNV